MASPPSTSSSASTARASRRSKRDALAAGGQRGAILARRLAGRRAMNQAQPRRQVQQGRQEQSDTNSDADHSFEANFNDADDMHDANENRAVNSSPVKTPSTEISQSTSIDRTADLTNCSSLNQSDLGALNISPVKKKASPSKSNGGNGSSGYGYARHEYHFDSSPDATPDRMAAAGAGAPLPSRSPAHSSGTPTKAAQPMTPGTAAARHSQERRRNKSSPGGSPHIIQQVGSDLTDDDAYNSPYRHGAKGIGVNTNGQGGINRDELHGRQGNAFHRDRPDEARQGVTLGIGQHPGVRLAGSTGSSARRTSSGSGDQNLDMQMSAMDAALAASNGGGRPPTTPGRRSTTSSAKSSPRTPGRGSPSRTSTATPPRPQTQLRPSPPRQLHSPPKRGVIPLHEAQAAARAAASALNGSIPGYAYSPQTAMDSSFERNIYGPGDTTALSSSTISSSTNNGAGDDDDGSGSDGGDGDDPLLDTSFESIVKEFTLDSSYVMEDAECELEEGEEAPDDEILMDDGLDDLEAFAAKAKAQAQAMAGAKTSSENQNSPARSAGSRSSRSSCSSNNVAERIAAVRQEVREADARGEWVSFDDDNGSDGGSSAFGTPHSGMDDNAVGAARVWPPPQTPTRSPPSSAGVSPAKATEASPDRSNGLSTDGDEHTIPSVSTATEGTERTNNMTPSRPNMLVVSTPRRSPPRGIITPSRIGVGANYGVSPGRFAAGVRLMDDDNTTIRTDDESYKFMTPQRAAQNGASVVPGTPVKPSTPLGLNSPTAGTPDTERDISFESSNDLNVTLDTIQANNTTSMIENEAALNLSFDARSVESDALQTVDDKSLGTRVSTSANSDVNSVVQEYNTKTGSKVIPGRSGYDNKEACGIFREFEDFLQSGFYDLADEFADSLRDFSKKVGYICVGDDEMKRLRNGDNNSDDRSRASSSGSSCSSRRGRRHQRLNRIMSTQRLRRVSSNRSHATSDSDNSRPVGRVPSRTGHQVKESFAC